MNRTILLTALVGLGFAAPMANAQTTAGYDFSKPIGYDYSKPIGYEYGNGIGYDYRGFNGPRDANTTGKPTPKNDYRIKKLKDREDELKKMRDRLNDWIKRQSDEHKSMNLPDPYLPGWIYEAPNARRPDTEYANREADVKRAERAAKTARELLNQPPPN